MMFIQLLYISEHEGRKISNLKEFMIKTRLSNKNNDLSSIILSTDKYYLQLLEGNRTDVNKMYNKINADDRHSSCTLLRYAEVKSREFGNWISEYVDISDFDIDGINLLTPRNPIDLSTITSTHAVTMFRRISAHLHIRAEKSLNPSV